MATCDNSASGEDSGVRGDSDVSIAAAERAASAAASAEAPPPSRALRAAAEALATEIVRASTIAEACAPRGLLRDWALCLSAAAAGAKEGAGGGGDGNGHGNNNVHKNSISNGNGSSSSPGAGLVDERSASIRAVAARVSYVIRRLESGGSGAASLESGDVGRRRSRSGAEEGGAAPAHDGAGGFVLSEAATGRSDGGASLTRLEVFRLEFVARALEAGGLKALALSWSDVASLEESFSAWVGEVRLR